MIELQRKPDITVYKKIPNRDKAAQSGANIEKIIEIILENAGKTICKDVIIKNKIPAKYDIVSVLYDNTQLLKGCDYTYDSEELVISVPTEIKQSEVKKIIITCRRKNENIVN